MRVTAWHNGQKHCGIKITKVDRDRCFYKNWNHVYISFCGGKWETFNIGSSFWRDCLEIRGKTIRGWFQTLGYVNENKLPYRRAWPNGKPPKLVLSLNKEGYKEGYKEDYKKDYKEGYFDLAPLRPHVSNNNKNVETSHDWRNHFDIQPARVRGI